MNRFPARITLARSAFAALALALTVTGAPLHAQAIGDQTAAVRKAVDDVWARAIAVHKKGDAAAVALVYSADGIYVAPDMPTLRGRAAIEAAMREQFKAVTLLNVQRTVDSFEVIGDVAIEVGSELATLQEKGKPSSTTLNVRYTIVWKRVGGAWLAAVVSETPAAPAPPPPAAKPASRKP